MNLVEQKSLIVSIDLDLSFDQILSNLRIQNYDASALYLAIQMEQEGMKRKPVEIALRRALLGKKGLDRDNILSYIRGSETRRRKRIVRKIYASTTIWAMHEIKKIYPSYTYEMLADDLKITKKKTPKITKGYRHSQIRSLFYRIREENYEGDTINKLSHLLVRHCENYRKPVIMDVLRENNAYTFQFPPTIDERKLKSFMIAIANGESIQNLQERYINTRYNTSGLNK